MDGVSNSRLNMESLQITAITVLKCILHVAAEVYPYSDPSSCGSECTERGTSFGDPSRIFLGGTTGSIGSIGYTHILIEVCLCHVSTNGKVF